MTSTTKTNQHSPQKQSEQMSVQEICKVFDALNLSSDLSSRKSTIVPFEKFSLLKHVDLIMCSSSHGEI